MSFLNELKRRNVLRVGVAYIVSSWLLIQVVETIFPLFGYGDTPARLVVIMLAIGFIPSMIFAWVFEITPEGLKRDADVDREKSITQATGKKLDRIILVVLALALAYFAFDKFVLDPVEDKQIAKSAHQEGRTAALTESYGDKSIAVLAFADMSPEGDQAYFSDGIAEELLNLLAKIPELRVISRSSAFSYKGKDVNLTQVAQELNVAHILEGSVRKSGNRLRITAQLIEAQSDTHVWSETYDRTLDDIFAIQDEIAAAVVEKLKLTLLSAPPVIEKTDPKAYALVLQARHLFDQQSAESLEQVILLLKQALVIAPNYPRAWTELARVYMTQVWNDQLSIQDSKELALEAIKSALMANPDYAPAHVLLGVIAQRYENDLYAAAQHYQRAMRLAPSNFSVASIFLFHLGRLDEAIAFQEKQVSRDPMYARGHFNLGIYYGQIGDLEKALSSFRNTTSLSPGFGGANFYIGLTLLRKNQPQAALVAMSEENNELDHIKGVALVLHELGQVAKFETVFGELKDRWGEEWPSEIAMVYAWIGDIDAAFQWLDKEIEVNGPYGWHEIPNSPLLQNLHGDPRWQALLTRVGVSAEQLASIEFKVNLPN